MQTRSHHSLRLPLAILPLLGFLVGCAEQPYGYIFKPEHRDQVNLARQTTDFLSSLYDHSDAAGRFLTNAGLTTDYRSILPDGWVDETPRDTMGHPIASKFSFSRDYLDQQFFDLNIDTAAAPNAIRNPATLNYDFREVASAQNGITRQFFGQTVEVRKLQISYGDLLRNPNFLDGWFSMRRIVAFDQELEVLVSGKAQKVTYKIYLPVTWVMKIKQFSIDVNDQRSHIVIDGLFPIYDKVGDVQECHVSGELVINTDGSGGGDVWLFGQPCVRLTFTGRSFGFKGSFSLASEDYKTNYNL